MLRSRLLHATRERHDRIERELPLPRDLGEHVRILRAWYGFLLPWELELALALPGAPYGRAARVARDLAELGLEPLEIARVPLCARLPDLASAGRALGSRYVIEGSSLGNRVLAAHLERELGLAGGRGYAYFAGAGAGTRARFDAFCEELEARGAGREAEVVAGACDTFDRLREWLCGAG